MDQLDAAGVAAWLADALKLPPYAAVVKEHAVDGEILLDLAERYMDVPFVEALFCAQK